MKKVKLAIFLILALFLTQITFAQISSDITLIEGRFDTKGSDPSIEDKINELLFRDAVIEISKKGEVTGTATTPITDYSFGGATYNGTATLTMNGEFDIAANRFSGTFKTHHDIKMENYKEPPLVSSFGNWTSTFSGTFTGGQSLQDGSIVFDFKGTKSDAGKIENSNGFVDDYNDSTKWTSRAIFTDLDKPISGVGLETPEDEITVTPIENDIILSRAVGDILISDPDERASVLTLAGRTLLAVSGRYDRRNDAWRKWDKPEEGAVLKPNTKLETSTGMGKVELKDGTVFILRMGSKALITKNGGIKLEKGSGYFIMPEGQKREVWARTGRIGVQGTEFSITDRENEIEIKLVEGKITVTNNSESESKTLEQGQYIVLTGESLGEIQEFESIEEKADWEALEKTIPNNITAKTPDQNQTVLGMLGVLFVVAIPVVVILIKRKKTKNE